MAITVQEAQVLFSADGMQQVNTEAKKAAGAMDGIVSAAKRAGGALGGIRSAFSGVGGILATVGAAAGVTKMLSLTAEAEKTAISFEVLTGSGEQARKMLDDIRKLDKKTVFGTQDLAQAQKLMMNFGMAGGEAFGVLTNLTEVAQGDTEQLMLLARGMAQVQAAGRLMGQEANQLINSGFSPLFEISKMTGRSMADLKKDMEEGKISYEMVRAALEGLTTGTGRLAGMNDRMSQSTAGQFAKFKTNVEQVAIAFGSALLPEINRFLEFLNSTAEGVTDVKTRTEQWLTTGKRFFTEMQNNLADFGVAVAVIGASLPEQFRLFFSDVQTWLGELVEYSMNAGKAIANNLRPDVILQELQGVAAFQALPQMEFSAAMSGGVLDQVKAELDLVRKQRIEANRAAARGPQAAAERNRGAAPPTQGADMTAFEQLGGAAAAQAEQQRTERAGALQTFQRLQDRLQQQDKLTGIAQNQLTAQQEAVKLLGSINGGLGGIATLGVLG